MDVGGAHGSCATLGFVMSRVLGTKQVVLRDFCQGNGVIALSVIYAHFISVC